MSRPQFDVQGSLFESLGAIASELFSDNDKYKRFAQKVWPVLAQSREQLLECYQADNGRPGVEPVVLLGVMIFQFLERVPDRQAVEMVKYHLGWKLALNLKLSEGAPSLQARSRNQSSPLLGVDSLPPSRNFPSTLRAPWLNFAGFCPKDGVHFLTPYGRSPNPLVTSI